MCQAVSKHISNLEHTKQGIDRATDRASEKRGSTL